MFTQHPIITEKNRNVEILANFLKKKNWTVSMDSMWVKYE